MADGSQTLCFTVAGEWLTDFARTRVIEGRWDHGMDTLKCIHGVDDGLALEILRGNKKFTGDSSDPDGLTLEDDDDVAYRKRLDYMFGGLWITSRGRFMRPYAFVSSWGPEDMAPATRDRGRRRGGWEHRSLYYADDVEQDEYVSLKTPKGFHDKYGYMLKEVDVLWREVRNVPILLVQTHHEAKDALEAFLAGHRLEERGYCRSFPKEYYPIRQETAKDEEPTLERTMPKLQKPEDVDVLVKHQRAQMEKGKKAEAEEIAAELDEAYKVVSDSDVDMKRRLAAWDQMQHGAERARRSVDAYRKLILEQAGDDMMDLRVDEKTTLKVPRAPFERWALNRTSWWHLGPKWDTVSPPGLKMFGDDPFHTDWVIGAGLAPEDWVMFGDDPLTRAAYDASHEVQARLMKFKIHVLSGSGSVYDKVVHLEPKERSGGRGRIMVIKNAGPDYVWAAEEAIKEGGVLICEQGGAMAHLVTVFRDQDLKIVRIPDARKLYPKGRNLTVDLDKGEIKAHDGGPMRLANGLILGDDEE